MAPKEENVPGNFYIDQTGDEYTAEKLQQMRNELSIRLVQAPAPEDLEEMMFANHVALKKEVQPMEEEEIIVWEEDEETPDALIPTQDRIEEIRRKRDKFRQLGYTQEDFLSLRKTDDEMDRVLLGGRKEDEPEYDTYGESATNQRVFGDQTKTAAGKQREMQRMQVYELEEEEEDEDTKEWQDSVLSKVCSFPSFFFLLPSFSYPS
jgi:hypothetical protein